MLNVRVLVFRVVQRTANLSVQGHNFIAILQGNECLSEIQTYGDDEEITSEMNEMRNSLSSSASSSVRMEELALTCIFHLVPPITTVSKKM